MSVAALQTWRSVEGQVSEVAALQELHRHASCGRVVGEAHQQLGDATVGQRLSGRGAVAVRHGRRTLLPGQILTTQKTNQVSSSRYDSKQNENHV